MYSLRQALLIKEQTRSWFVAHVGHIDRCIGPTRAIVFRSWARGDHCASLPQNQKPTVRRSQVLDGGRSDVFLRLISGVSNPRCVKTFLFRFFASTSLRSSGKLHNHRRCNPHLVTGFFLRWSTRWRRHNLGPPVISISGAGLHQFAKCRDGIVDKDGFRTAIWRFEDDLL